MNGKQNVQTQWKSTVSGVCMYLVIIIVFMHVNGLRGHVVDSAAANVPLNAGVVQLYLVGNAKVNQTQGRANAHKILWLEVVVDHIFVMNNLQQQKDANCIRTPWRKWTTNSRTIWDTRG